MTTTRTDLATCGVVPEPGTALVPLTKGLVAVVDQADLEAVLAEGKWYALTASPRCVYAARKIRLRGGQRRLLYLHTFLTGWPLVDHVNRDGLNNTRANLRHATKAQNAVNSGPPRHGITSKYKGVSWDTSNRRWRAQLCVDGHSRLIGRFVTPEEAARAYDRAVWDARGEYAYLNFPEELILWLPF